MRNLAIVLVTSVLCVAACAGSTSTAEDISDSTGGATESSEAAAALIARHGSDQAAADALIIAMERGYSRTQIVNSVNENTLRSNGTIEAENPAGAPLGLVLYDANASNEGASGAGDRHRGEVVLVSFFQVEQTPIELIRANASRELGAGEPATDQILRLLLAGYDAADVVEMLILGIDQAIDHPERPEDLVRCARVVDEIYCPFGERFPIPASTTADSDQSATTDPPAPTSESNDTTQQLLWEGEMTANPDLVDNPVAGAFELRRAPGTDDFDIRLATAEDKEGTFTPDGFNTVECTTRWSSVFEGSGSFSAGNQMVLEFDGQITRSRVYVAGPCDSALPTETQDFSGVAVFVTDAGIEASFNGWEFSVTGSRPGPTS